MTDQEVILKESERVDDLLSHNLRIIQSDEVFSFSMDAVLLARFASVPKEDVFWICAQEMGSCLYY